MAPRSARVDPTRPGDSVGGRGPDLADSSEPSEIQASVAEGDSLGGSTGSAPTRAAFIADPVVLRALAHPARQQLVAELYAGTVLTATEAAELVGLTPSAVSHHLRALAKYGLAERAEPTGDGRERPWRATGSDFNLSMPSGSASVRAMQTVTRTAIGTAADELDALLEGKAGEPWPGHRGLSRETLWLTQEETKAFGDALTTLIERFHGGRNTNSHPQQSRRTELTVMFLPLEGPPDADEGSASGSEAGND
jgi:DNA-binding transcriptional ArsR family regulator